MPSVITYSNGNNIEIIYDANGGKLRKIVKVGATVQYEQDYLGGLEYRKVGTNAKRLEAVYHDEGRFYNLNVEVNNTLSIRYEYSLRDHLGNTRLTFTDKNANGIVDITNSPSTSDILQENHYYPFGMAYEGPWLMNDAARDTKYQYNGKEMNDDFGLNWMDYGARWYDAAIGRWNGVDPLADKYSDLSSYCFAANNPIYYVDPNGKEIWVAFDVTNDDGSTTTQKAQYIDGKLYSKNGTEYTEYTGGNAYATKVLNDLNQLAKDDPELFDRIFTLQESENIHTISMVTNTEEGNSSSALITSRRNEGKPTGSDVQYNPDAKADVRGNERAPRVGLAHELLGHSYDTDQGTTDKRTTENGIPMSEVSAVNVENIARAATGDSKRTTYGDKEIPSRLLKDTHNKKKP